MSELKRYRDWKPTFNDPKGLSLAERQDWFVAPVIQTRDSEVLERSNFAVVLREIEKVNKEDNPNDVDFMDSYEVHRFGHWGPGWYEIILCRPESKCARVAAEFACALADYPIADDSHFSEMELEEAQQVWKDCYNDQQRLEYIRKHRSQFEFHSFVELLQCVRGLLFCGSASELLE